MKTKLTLLSEGCFREAKVKEGDGGVVISDVVLLGSHSRNGRTYLPAAMQDAAHRKLYDGVQCFLDHITGDEMMSGRRSVRNIAGIFENTHFDTSKIQIRGDVRLLTDDEAGRKFLNIARQMPEAAGLSHNAQGETEDRDGEEIIVAIEKVFSVDLVADPATTTGIHEDKQENEMDWKEVTAELLKTHRHDVYEELVKFGALSRNEEVKQLKEDSEKAKSEADKLKVLEAKRQNEALVDVALGKSDLPDYAKTEDFRSQLLKEETADGVAKLIKDRMELLANKEGGVKGMGESRPAGTKSGDKISTKDASDDVDF